MLVELALSLALLTSIGLVVFQGSLDILAPRQWIIQQNMSDAYLTYEEAYAQRISFEELTSIESPWPVYPQKVTTEVEIGKFPGGRPIMADVTRTRIPDDNNLPDNILANYGGTGTQATNPSEMQTWQGLAVAAGFFSARGCRQRQAFSTLFSYLSQSEYYSEVVALPTNSILRSTSKLNARSRSG